MNNKYNSLQILFRVYKNTLKAVPFSGAFGIINYLAQGLLPAFIALIQTKLFNSLLSLNSMDFKMTIILGCMFVLAYAIAYILQFISSITINAGIYEKCTSYYKMKMSEKSASLSLLDYEDTNILNLNNRAKDCVNREILSQLYMSSAILITSAISVIATIFVLASYNVWFIPISFFSVVPYLVARIIRGKEFYHLKASQSQKRRTLEYLWGLFQNKQAIKEMRVMGFGTYIYQKWSITNNNVNEEIWSHNKKDAKILLLCDIFKILGYGTSIFIALYLVIEGIISIGVFGACIAAFKSLQEATKSFLIELGNMPEKISFARDFFEFIDLSNDQNGKEMIAEINDIVLRNVYFSYPNSSAYALNNISLSIKKGETIVVLGENGSGKSTLSKVIANAYSPSKGEVYYNNVPSSRLDKTSLYSRLSIVPQNFTEYYLTLRENIAISELKKYYDDELIHNTLQMSGLNKFENLDIQLGREFGGIELSGGQWQKIAIARGLFKNSDVIILDEPTSSLDPIIESEVLRRFVEVSYGKTTIIVSHRVGLCRLADRIIVMKKGKICEIGNHSELIEKRGEYYNLYSAQEQWYL